jgi:outer membrane protein assembly factor BamE
MRILPLALACSMALTGCASFTNRGAAATDTGAAGTQTKELTKAEKALWLVSPYRISIQQGNFVSQENVAQLKEGMTRDQVRNVLGTPLLADAFHADRWDYPFRLQRGNGEVLSSRVSVFFKDGFVARFEGGDLPSEKEYIARIAGSSIAPLRADAPLNPGKPDKKK